MKIADLSSSAAVTAVVRLAAEQRIGTHLTAALRSKRAAEHETLVKQLVAALVAAPTMDEFCRLLTEGWAQHGQKVAMQNPASDGVAALRSQLCDNSAAVPCRLDKIAALVLGSHKETPLAFNRGNIWRTVLDDFAAAYHREGAGAEWGKVVEAYKQGKAHTYREAPAHNQNGHGNCTMSFWALGYNSLREMEAADPDRYAAYVAEHATRNCCGLAPQLSPGPSAAPPRACPQRRPSDRLWWRRRSRSGRSRPRRRPKPEPRPSAGREGSGWPRRRLERRRRACVAAVAVVGVVAVVVVVVAVAGVGNCE